MGKFEAFCIYIKQLPLGHSTVNYHLTSEYFGLFEEEEIQQGDVTVTVDVDKANDATKLTFQLEGVVNVTCDRCLDEMQQNIRSSAHLTVRLGDEYSDDGDETIVVPEEQGVLNVAWLLHEYVTLAVPLKHVHAYGLCNKNMADKLGEHIVGSTDDDKTFADDVDNDAQTDTDPRWDALEGLKIED